MKKEQLLVLIGLLLMELVTTVDHTGVTVLLPTLRAVYQVAPAFEAWAMLAYLIPFFLLLVPMGYLADRFHCAEKMIVWSILLFGLSALLCGLAPNQILFGLFRATKGIGAAGMYACEFAIILKYWREPRRVVEIVMTGIAAGVLLGPVVGGFFAGPALWRYFFFFSAFLAFSSFFLYQAIRRLTPVPRLADQTDLSGQSIGQKLRLLSRLLAWGLFLNLVISAANQGLLLLITLEVQEHQGRSALFNSAILSVVALSMITANAIGLGSRLFRKLEHAVVAAGLLVAAGLVALSTLNAWTDPLAFILYAVLGLGVGVFYATVELMALDPLPSGLMAQGNGWVVTSMECGYALSSFVIPLLFAALGTAATAYSLSGSLLFSLGLFWFLGKK
jgi:MFS family permease